MVTARWALLFLVAACGDSGVTGPITAHVTHYDYALDLDSHAAHSKVTLIADKAGDCMTLPFRAAGVTAVEFDDAAADGTVNGDTLEICGHSVGVGDKFTIAADVTIALATLKTSQVGFSVENDAQSHPFTYLVSWVNGCDQFGPCDNRPDQFATYTFDVTHTADLTVRCPGDVTDKTATETICDFKYPGGPTYSTFGIAAYPAWTQSDAGTWSGVHVTVYDRASTGIAAAIDPAYHTGFLDWMQSEFGPWPFGSELRVLTAPTYWDGFEHPGNIVLDDGLVKEQGYAHPVAHVLDHEMTHMWAGDQTTLADTYDFVWKEAMAEYLSFVWEDMNDQVASAATSNVWKVDAHVASYWPVPEDHPKLFDYYTDVYGPGPMVLFRQLEVLTSRAQVLAAIKSVLGAQQTLSVDALIAALAQSTGLDLADYVNGWIKGMGTPTWPAVKTTFTPGATSTDPGSLAVSVTNGAPGRCKFHVALGDGGANSVKVAVDTFANGPTQTVMVPAIAFTVSAITLDPDHECLVYPSSMARTADEPPPHGWLSSHARGRK